MFLAGIVKSKYTHSQARRNPDTGGDPTQAGGELAVTNSCPSQVFDIDTDRLTTVTEVAA